MVVLITVAGAALLGACSTGSTPTTSSTSPLPHRGASTSASSSTVSSTAPSTTTTSTVLPQGATSTEFLSPSGNIGCEIDNGNAGLTQAYCQTVSPPASAVLKADSTLTECSGQNCLGNAGVGTPTLHYGTSVALGPFTCLSTISGVRCTLANGNGFMIAKTGVTPIGAVTVTPRG